MTNFERRRSAALERLPDGVDLLLVTTPANVRYLTGFTGSNGQVLLAESSVFYTDGRYDEQAATEVADIDRLIYSGSVKLSDLLAKALANRGVTTLGVEGANVTLQTMERLRTGLDGVELTPTTDVVEGVRARKDADEIDAIRNAQRIAEIALVAAVRDRSQATELELALAIEWAIRTGGAEDVSFEPIVAGGAHSALPHATPRPERIDADGVLLLDIGARANGYCSDMTRTYLGPRAPEELVRAHAAVVEALDAACAAVRPGVKASEVDAAARGILDAAGLGETFVHSTGHGVGLEIHEGPSLTMTSEEVLEPGMVVTIEPGVYLPGVGGIRVEDLLVVIDSGAENLTSIDRSSTPPS